MRTSLVVAGLLFVVAVAYWFGADAIPKSRLGGAVGADGLPKLLAVTLGFLSLALAGQAILEARKRRGGGAAAAAGTGGPINIAAHLRAFGLIAIGIGYIVLLPILGYAVTIALLLVAVALYAGRPPSMGVALFGVGGAVVFYLLFVKLLQVPLPAGFWPALFG